MYILVLLIAIAILAWEHWQFMTPEERFKIVDEFDNRLFSLHSKFRETIWYKYYLEKRE